MLVDDSELEECCCTDGSVIQSVFLVREWGGGNGRRCERF